MSGGVTSRRIALVAALYPAGLVAMSAIHLLFPQRSGPLAISQILAPHLFLAASVFVPFAFVPPARVLRISLLLALAVFLVRFGPAWPSRPVPVAGAPTIAVASWNLLSDGRDQRPTIDRLWSTDASVVGLQELSVTAAALIEADATLTDRFPYRLLAPRRDVLGMGLLSSHPVLESGSLAIRPSSGRCWTWATAAGSWWSTRTRCRRASAGSS